MAYELGVWKKSTVETLHRLKEENVRGRTPTSTFFKNGSIAQWLSLLLKGGHVNKAENGGYMITSKGETLLEQLEKDPSKLTAPEKKSKRSTRKKQSMNWEKNQFYVEIFGEKLELNFEVNADENKLLRAVTAFKEELSKK